jgi:hypothetical protein
VVWVRFLSPIPRSRVYGSSLLFGGEELESAPTNVTGKQGRIYAAIQAQRPLPSREPHFRLPIFLDTLTDFSPVKPFRKPSVVTTSFPSTCLLSSRPANSRLDPYRLYHSRRRYAYRTNIWTKLTSHGIYCPNYGKRQTLR